MKNSIKDKILNEKFILFNILFSFTLAILYLIRGFQEGFLLGTYYVIGLNLLSIPLALIFKKKGFSFFYLFYALLLVFVIAFEQTYLFNNYSALFMICIVIMIQPKLEIPAFVLYFLATSIAFILNSETLIHFFIHIVRGFWFTQIISYTLNNKFERKKLILYEDEIKILDQLCEGKIYQKEVEGFSENTIYRKLKAARERNGNITREQLVDLYRKEKENKNDH